MDEDQIRDRANSYAYLVLTKAADEDDLSWLSVEDSRRIRAELRKIAKEVNRRG